MSYKDTRRSDKFSRTKEHFKKNNKEFPKKKQIEYKFEGYTEFLKSKENIGEIDIREHMENMKTYTHYYKYPNSVYSVPTLPLSDLSNNNDDDEINPSEIFFEKDYTINVAHKYKNLYSTKNVCILNFASAKNPGGGFMNGSMAQEESIAYVSTLYHSLITSDMYEINREDSKNGLYNDIAIYTNEICVFRLNRDGDYIKPFYISVISCPAPNKNHALKCNINEKSIMNKLKDRIKLIFEVASIHKVKILILGAYGTGVFGNDTYDVKTIFNELLENEYKNCFEKIIYAIPDEEKYKIFASLH
jgi:uncharacterized protein (TIGR02452 family)